MKPLTVGLLLYPRVELLDFAGPGEVFDVAGDGKAFDVVTVAESVEPVNSQGFLTVVPQRAIDGFRPDVLVVPGGNSEWLVQADGVLEWIRDAYQHATHVLTVCTGALALAKLGLLDGMQATTHRSALDRLRAMAPNTQVLEDRRVVDNGKLVVTAGVSAGIDGSLHMVSKILGIKEARRTAEFIELDWNEAAAAAG